jgi:hypothetical protein
MILLFVSIAILSSGKKGICQGSGTFQPFTKWYQDPLGARPLDLSTAFGFVWASVATTACLVFTKNDSVFRKKFSCTGNQDGEWVTNLLIQKRCKMKSD